MRTFDAYRSLVLSLALAGAFALSGAEAQFAGDTPSFSTVEEQVFRDNPDLEQLKKKDPGLARFVLNELSARAESSPRGADHPAKDMALSEEMKRDPDLKRLLESNPALAEMARSSPEAAHDLLVLIRSAAGKPGNTQQ